MSRILVDDFLRQIDRLREHGGTTEQSWRGAVNRLPFDHAAAIVSTTAGIMSVWLCKPDAVAGLSPDRTWLKNKGLAPDRDLSMRIVISPALLRLMQSVLQFGNAIQSTLSRTD